LFKTCLKIFGGALHQTLGTERESRELYPDLTHSPTGSLIVAGYGPGIAGCARLISSAQGDATRAAPMISDDAQENAPAFVVQFDP